MSGQAVMMVSREAPVMGEQALMIVSREASVMGGQVSREASVMSGQALMMVSREAPVMGEQALMMVSREAERAISDAGSEESDQDRYVINRIEDPVLIVVPHPDRNFTINNVTAAWTNMLEQD